MADKARGIFIILLVLLLIHSAISLICICDYHCPDNHKNFTCETDYKCFASQVMKEGTSEKVMELGCIGETGGDFQCRSNKIIHSLPRAVECCDDHDGCNEYLHPTIKEEEVQHYVKLLENEKRKKSTNPSIALVVTVTVCLTVLVILVSYLYLRYRQIKAKRILNDSERRVFISNGTAPIHSLSELYASSGTGSGIPALTLRSIAREITIYEEIGCGRFSTVHKGRWMHQYVAVKTILACDEVSLTRELEMFKTGNMNHDNLLGFIAADITDVYSDGTMFRWVITAYHQYGSLYDFLQVHSFDYRILFRLTYSAISGLHYMHRSIAGTQGKPSIAHRDIKSKNIYVKDNLQCCIGDLGLAVKIDEETKELNFDISQKLSTIRYMAPEILEDKNFSLSLMTYQKADIYAFGLVIWELLRRYEVNGAEALEYKPPYYEYVTEHPTIVDMKALICTQHLRPQLPNHYDDDPHGKIMLQVMRECCHYSPLARLTSLRIKKTLQKCVQDQDLVEGSGGSNSCNTASTGLS